MTVAACPFCQEKVTVPSEAPSDSRVRCPLCQEEYALAEVLDRLPPALILVTHPTAAATRGWSQGSAAATAAESHSGFDFGALASKTATEEETDEETDEETGFVISPKSSVPESAVSPATSATRAPRRPAKKPAVEMMKILAGGLLAVPLAQMILWWLPGKWQRDPLKIGPTVGQYVPWVVPQNYRPVALEPASTAGGVPADASQVKQGTLTRPPAKSAADLEGSPQVVESPSNPLPDGDPTSRGVPGTPPATNPPADTQANDDASGTTTPPANDGQGGGFGQPPTTSPADNVAAGNSVGNGAANDSSSGFAVGVKDAPQLAAVDLAAALDRAMLANGAWDAAPDEMPVEDREQLAKTLFAAMTRLGEVVTFVDPADPDAPAQVLRLDQLLQPFAEQPNKLAMLGNHASDWWDNASRTGNGFVVYGTVKKVQPAGLLFETQLETASREKKSISIMSRVDPIQIYGPKSRVMILGWIVDQPSLNLLGYRGNQSRVVMAGYPIVVQK